MKNCFTYVFSFFLLTMTFYGAAMGDDCRASLKELVASVAEEYGPSYDGSHRFNEKEKQKKENKQKKRKKAGEKLSYE